MKILVVGDKDNCQHTLTIIQEYSNKTNVDVSPDTQNDVEENHENDERDDGEKDSCDRLFIVEAPAASEAFDSPTIETRAADPISGTCDSQTTAASNPDVFTLSPLLDRASMLRAYFGS